MRENDGVEKLRELLSHKEASVKLAVATFLLKHYEQDAITVLENIEKASIPHTSFLAKMVLQEWRNSRLNM